MPSALRSPAGVRQAAQSSVAVRQAAKYKGVRLPRSGSTMTAPLLALNLSARSTVRSLVASQIREVANAGMGDPDIQAFWFGEPDEVTPVAIRDTAIAALAAGETFYTQNFGIPELRGALSS